MANKPCKLGDLMCCVSKEYDWAGYGACVGFGSIGSPGSYVIWSCPGGLCQIGGISSSDTSILAKDACA